MYPLVAPERVLRTHPALRARSVALALLMTLSLQTACQRSPESEAAPQSAPARAASGVPAPGLSATSTKVTKADYEDAVARTKACMAEDHVELVDSGWDPVGNQRILLSYRADKSLSEDDVFTTARRCRQENLDSIEERFAQTNPAMMDPKLMNAVQGCLRGNGLPISGREKNPADLMRSIPAGNVEDLLGCVHQNANSMYPGLAIEFP